MTCWRVLTLLAPAFGLSCTSVTAGEPSEGSALAMSLGVRFALPQGGVERFEPRDGRLVAMVRRRSFPSTARPAVVSFPAAADGLVAVEDLGTSVGVRFRLESASAAPAALTADWAIYRTALGPSAHLAHRPHFEGTEDYVLLDAPLPQPQLTYSVDVTRVAGLRLVAGVLEFVDEGGAPRLRVAPPYLLGADGVRRSASLQVLDCPVDTDPRGPWGRSPVPPGKAACRIRVRWQEAGLAYPALVDPVWTTTGSMAVVHASHSAFLLSTGKVLVAGGCDGTTGTLRSELFDPTTGTWAQAASLNSTHGYSPAFTVPTVGPFFFGGGVGANCGGLATNVVENYSEADGTWHLKAPLPLTPGVAAATGVLLGSNTVLVAGGTDFFSSAQTNLAELYNVGADSWTALPNMQAGRVFATATLLPNGKALVAGGANVSGTLVSAELYDPGANTWTFTSTPMVNAHAAAAAFSVAGNQVLVVGGGPISACGGGYGPGGNTIGTSDLYDVATDSWTSAGVFSLYRPRGFGAGFITPDGKAAFLGGLYSCPGPGSTNLDLYDPVTRTWLAGTPMNINRSAHTATTLTDGRVLVAGGFGDNGQSAELYALGANGTACANLTECLSGHCVGGVCCNTACDAGCESCLAANKQSGPSGTCGPAKIGTDPNNDCTDDGAPGCGQNGLCDGDGGCQRYPTATQCTPNPCAQDTDCTSGHCAGICCNQACNGPCVGCTRALKDAGNDGVCGNVPVGTNPTGGCAADPGYPNTCGSDGLCDGQGSCRSYALQGTSCGTVTCANGQTSTLSCNAGGQCVQQVAPCTPAVCIGDHTLRFVDGTVVDCTPYRCESSACKSSCASVVDCVPPNTCNPNTRACAAAPQPPAPASSGCGCAFGSGPATWLALLAWAAAAIVRRPSRQT